MPDSSGWPFLVAAGRHRDYSTLLAPDFLVADLDFGFLDEVTRPSSDRPTVVDVQTRAGRPLTVAYATRVVTSADLDPAAPATALTDEVGRPLRLIYGFVTRQRLVAIADEDLATAFDVAIAVYRRFLRDEDALIVARGQSFPLRSRLAPPGPVASVPSVALPSLSDSRSRRRPVALAVGVLAAALAALAVIAVVGADHPKQSACPPATASPAAVERPSPDASDSCAPSPVPSRTRLSG